MIDDLTHSECLSFSHHSTPSYGEDIYEFAEHLKLRRQSYILKDLQWIKTSYVKLYQSNIILIHNKIVEFFKNLLCVHNVQYVNAFICDGSHEKVH